MACQDDDGGTSGMQGANLSGHEGLPRWLPARKQWREV
jgi:hypothetical protein